MAQTGTLPVTEKTPALSWIYAHRRRWRALLLALALFSLMGPWAYEALYIPSQYPCAEPGLRVAEDRCAMTLSGVNVLTLALSGFVGNGLAILTGAATLSERGREFLLVAYFVLPLSPLVSSLLLVLKDDSRRLRLLHIIAWGLAFITSLTLLAIGRALAPDKLWGIWSYAGIALSAVVLETLAWRTAPQPLS